MRPVPVGADRVRDLEHTFEQIDKPAQSNFLDRAEQAVKFDEGGSLGVDVLDTRWCLPRAGNNVVDCFECHEQILPGRKKQRVTAGFCVIRRRRDWPVHPFAVNDLGGSRQSCAA